MKKTNMHVQGLNSIICKTNILGLPIVASGALSRLALRILMLSRFVSSSNIRPHCNSGQSALLVLATCSALVCGGGICAVETPESDW